MMVDTRTKRRVVGDLRPSQLVYSFGVGSVIDLPHISAMMLGLDDWEDSYNRLAALEVPPLTIAEDRLLQAVKQQLGDQVSELRAAPIPPPDESPSARWKTGPKPTVGVPLVAFPQWMLCPACRLLAPLRSDLFKLRANPYRPEETRYLHENCRKAPNRAALPARFLVACAYGHIDDFPWIDFVHGGPTNCRARLRMFEFGSSGDARSIEVRCEECGSRRRMADAFAAGAAGIGDCSGRRPHLRDYEDKACTGQLRTISLGASNAWFPVTLSALSIPPAGDDLTKLVNEHWSDLGDLSAPSEINLLRRRNLLAEFARYSTDEIWEAIEAKQLGSDVGSGDPSDLKSPEWRVFTNPDPERNSNQFLLRETDPPRKFAGLIERVVVAQKLREVRALRGFTRIESPGFGGEWNLGDLEIAPLSRRAPTWLPAVEVRGEGVFIQFREEAILAWQDRLYQIAGDRYYAARRRWQQAQGKTPTSDEDGGFARFLLIHSLSHALMREFALESGYAVASIRERIYAAAPDSDTGPMAGLLLYTSASDSEGTLGGLAKLGEPDQLERNLTEALIAVQLCASDPPCAERVPEPDDFVLNWAACHACLFAPETSCERGNQLLDRTVLVETFQATGIGFFPTENDGDA